MLLTTLFLFFISCIVLVISGGWLVKLLSKIAHYLKLSEFVVAFIIMAFSTSIPELFVGISSAIKGVPSLALGNIMGANILDLTFVMGLTALIGRGIKIESVTIRRDAWLMFLVALAPLILIILGKDLSRIDGIVLVAVFIYYMYTLYRERKIFREKFDRVERKNFILNIFLFVMALGILFISSRFVVQYAIELSIELMLPKILIGLFLVSIGTTLPELVFGIRAVLAKSGDMAVGDVMGSVVCNSTLILGITAIIAPITGNFLLFLSSAIFMVSIAFLFMVFIRSKKGLNIPISISLIFLYILFVLVEIYFGTKV